MRSPSGQAADFSLKHSTVGDGDEGLPEWEPLTPELVEDEALRGDVMLRWTVVLLALLLGWTEISDTPTLVQIRTGQYLAANGWLPPANDVFSSTATDRPWINLSWLSDLVLAGVYGLGNAAALSIAGAFVAGVCFWLLVNTSRAAVSTWWCAVCAGLALLAAFPLLQFGPDTFTLLGLSLTLFILSRAEQRPQTRSLWALPVLFLLWSNLDSHAFLGGAVLLAYAIGRTFGGTRESGGASVKQMWIVTAVSIAAMIANPFHWHVFEAPWLMYGVEYVEARAYTGSESKFPQLWLPLTDRVYWDSVDVFGIAGLIIAAAALLAMALNYRRLRCSHVCLWLAMNALALAAGRQLAAAGIVNAALAALNGQDWYRANFRQAYSTESLELLFSRAGRAVTVLALFGLGYLGISGRLMGPDGRRLGFGFEPALEANIASFEDVLADSYDDRPFSFLPEQGDILIWIGQRPFIDSRLALYGSGATNLGALHRRLRLALRRQRDGDDPHTDDAAFWTETFDKYHITHALPRLSGGSPDYLTFFDLLSDSRGRWRLVKLGAATASLYRVNSNDAELTAFIAERPGINFARLAFPLDSAAQPEKVPSQLDWPREKTWYDRMFMLPRTRRPGEVQIARHYAAIRSLLVGGNVEDDLSLAILTIRHARRGLLDDPSSAMAYQSLMGSYLALINLDGLLQQQFGSLTALPLRTRELISAMYQTLACNPQNSSVHMDLFEILLATGKPDLAVAHLKQYQQMTGRLTTVAPTDPSAEAQSDRNREILTQLTKQIDEARAEVNLEIESRKPPLETVQFALGKGLPGEALRILEENRTDVAQNPLAGLIHAELMLDAGRLEDGLSLLEQLSGTVGQDPSSASAWRNIAAPAYAAVGNFDRAIELWREEARKATEVRLQSMLSFNPVHGGSPALSSVPLSASPGDAHDSRPMVRSAVLGDYLVDYPRKWALAEFSRALCYLEQGSNDRAVAILQQILEFDPESPARPAVAFYLSVITGTPVDTMPPSQKIPVWDGMFAPNEASPDDSQQPVAPTDPPPAQNAPDEAAPSDKPSTDAPADAAP